MPAPGIGQQLLKSRAHPRQQSRTDFSAPFLGVLLLYETSEQTHLPICQPGHRGSHSTSQRYGVVEVHAGVDHHLSNLPHGPKVALVEALGVFGFGEAQRPPQAQTIAQVESGLLDGSLIDFTGQIREQDLLEFVRLRHRSCHSDGRALAESSTERSRPWECHATRPGQSRSHRRRSKCHSPRSGPSVLVRRQHR